MTLDDIKQLVEFIRQHELTEFELEQDGVKLRIKSGQTLAASAAPAPSVAPAAAQGAAGGSVAEGLAASAGPRRDTDSDVPTDEEGTELAIVKSPIVGTFYRSPEPDAPAFVEIGSMVKKSQVLCIIEAMKLMNEIDSEYDGEIAKIYVENGQPVQYGERLFAIRMKG